MPAGKAVHRKVLSIKPDYSGFAQPLQHRVDQLHEQGKDVIEAIGAFNKAIPHSSLITLGPTTFMVPNSPRAGLSQFDEAVDSLQQGSNHP